MDIRGGGASVGLGDSNFSTLFQTCEMFGENKSNSLLSDYQYDYGGHWYDYEEYLYDYDPSQATITMGEMVVPLVVYSITFTIGLFGNILILLAVRGKKQVKETPGVSHSMKQPWFGGSFQFFCNYFTCFFLFVNRLEI